MLRLASFLACATALTGCAHIQNDLDALDPPKNPQQVLLAPGESGPRAISPLSAANYIVLQEAMDADGQPVRTVGDADMRRYLAAGFALADTYCEDYFRLTDEAQRRRNFGRALNNDVGTAVSTVLGLANAGENVVTGVAAGFGLLDSTFRNYDEAFIAGPDLAQTRTLVLSHQDSFRARTLAAGATLPADYGTAQSVILRYANMCSFLGMRALLNSTAAAASNALQNDRNGTPVDRQGNAPAAQPPGADAAAPAIAPTPLRAGETAALSTNSPDR